jgi:hypothetical protein
MLLHDNLRQKTQKTFITLYLIIYSVFFITNFLDTTMFRLPQVVANVFAIMLQLGFGLVVSKILIIDKHKKEEILLYVFLAICLIGTVVHTGYVFLAFDLVLILGAKDVPFEKLVKLNCAIAGTLLVITMVSSQVGLVENLVYIRDGTSRYSFGINYPTDFTAHIFFIVMGYCYIRKEKLSFFDLTAILGLSIFSYIFCDARTNALCLLLTFVVFLYLKVKNLISDKKGSKYIMNPKCSKILAFSMPICAFFFIGLTFFYHFQRSNNIISIINNLVSGRFLLGSIGFEKYGIHLFGSSFQMFGYGGSTTPPNVYFFLDSSYVLILIRYGILVFITVMIIYVMSSLHAVKQEDITLLWILTLVAIQCMLEHHLLEIAYNPFLLFVLSKKFSRDQEDSSSRNDIRDSMSES